MHFLFDKYNAIFSPNVLMGPCSAVILYDIRSSKTVY